MASASAARKRDAGEVSAGGASSQISTFLHVLKAIVSS